MAKALIIDDEFGKLANAYYGLIPNEPLTATTSLTVDSRTTIPKTSLKTLLSTIKGQAKAGDDLIIVSHGNQNGMIMKLNPDAKNSHAAITARLNTLTGTESAADKAKQLGLSEDQVKELLSLIADVQSINLGHVAFRGCSIGINTNNLSTLRDVLGAKVVSGTDMLSTYGATPKPWIEVKSGEFDKWKTSYGKNSNLWSDKVMFYSVDTKDHTTRIGLFVRDKNDLGEWLKVMFLPSRKNTFENFMQVSIPVHYLDDSKPILPQESDYGAHTFTSA